METRQQEFERIAMPHSRSLLRVARRLTSEATEDLVQETLLLAWRGFSGFQRGSNVRAWLFRILFNVYYARARKVAMVPFAEPIPVEYPLAENLDVTQAFEEMTREHRTVLLLAVVEGFTCKEMSEILAMPIGTVMSRLSRARQALRSRLTPGVRCAGRGM